MPALDVFIQISYLVYLSYLSPPQVEIETRDY